MLHSLAQAQLLLVLRSALAQALGSPSEPLVENGFFEGDDCVPGLEVPFPSTFHFSPGPVSLLMEVACLGFGLLGTVVSGLCFALFLLGLGWVRLGPELRPWMLGGGTP